MPAYVPEVIAWTFVVAFVLCMIAGLLTMTGVWTPPDPKVRKWLLNGVLISAVGAVVTFGVRTFSAPTSPSHDNLSNIAQPAPAPERPRPQTPRPPQAQLPPIHPEPDPQPAALEISENLRLWAVEALGPRPIFPVNAVESYPRCVESLNRSNLEEVTSAAARACLRDLRRFHREVILSYYNAKGPYDDRLEAQELELRGGRLQPDELERFNFIRDEMDRLNGSDSEEVQRLSSVEDRLLADLGSCNRSRCRHQRTPQGE